MNHWPWFATLNPWVKFALVLPLALALVWFRDWIRGGGPSRARPRRWRSSATRLEVDLERGRIDSWQWNGATILALVLFGFGVGAFFLSTFGSCCAARTGPWRRITRAAGISRESPQATRS